MKQHKQISETILLGALLAMVGGFLDAYTFICRGGVFANAQTGNIVLLGVKFAERDYVGCLHYTLPILSFVVGVFIAESIRRRFKESAAIHWRQIIIAFEITILAAIAFIPASNDLLANILVSFVCSMQVQSFRKVNGNNYATTMCTGNLRSGTECLYAYKISHNEEDLKKSMQYYGIIIFFIIGALVGALLISIFAASAIFFACAVLAVVFALMFIKSGKDESL